MPTERINTLLQHDVYIYLAFAKIDVLVFHCVSIAGNVATLEVA
jgi:hypothetical protein